jgi:hypothetical protein
MPSYDIRSVLAGTSTLVAVARVTTREELEKALRERTQVIIADKKLARPFEWLLWAQELRWWYLGTLAAIVIAYAISQQNKMEFRHTEWRAGRTNQDEIIITPTTKPPPSRGLEEE